MTKNTTQTIDTLATAAAEIAMDAAAKTLRAEFQNGTLDVDALVDAVRVQVKIAILPAIERFREAADCGMTEIATTTFRVEMERAGQIAALPFDQSAPII